MAGLELEPYNRSQSVQEWLKYLAVSNSAAPDVQLISAVGIDYTTLRDLLAAGKWREADKETQRVMLKVAGTYAYYEIAERALVEVTPGEKFLFQGFKGANAQQLFEMTRKF